MASTRCSAQRVLAPALGAFFVSCNHRPLQWESSNEKRSGRATTCYHAGICGGRGGAARPHHDPGGVFSMTFHSILFERSEDNRNKETPEAPAFFVDLNLDQVVDAITAGKQEYHLQPFFYTSLHDLDAITYRHEILRDLENQRLLELLQSFAQKMSAMRKHLAQAEKLHYKYQKERWFLDAVEMYCDAVVYLVHDLSLIELQSRGFQAFRDYVTNYASSGLFTSLQAETSKLLADLSVVHYCLLIRGNSVKVRKYEAESDYSIDVEETFAKFKQGAVKDYRVKFKNWPEMDHVEAQILDLVARLYPEVFLPLDDYCGRNRNYLDEPIASFDREIQFYIAYLEYIARLKQAGLQFCYPHISTATKEVHAYGGFDIALAYKLMKERAAVVCNDFSLQGKERIMVVTGPNQGGKTTFARTFGQMHYLASLGCPVPGSEAQLLLFDQLFTHFEKEENIKDLRGKLEDDPVRIHSIVDQATSNSIVILNEMFNSTTVDDALFLSQKIMERILQLDLLCVWVTFIDELASFSEKNVSMVSTVVPDNPALRTFKIVRKPADGLAYALAIAEKYRLTYASVKERIQS
jgi:DNA mismatch repair protein MutS